MQEKRRDARERGDRSGAKGKGRGKTKGTGKA